MVEEFNQLYDTEANLFTTFESDLDADPELGTFASGDAGVFQNIEDRQSNLDRIIELNSNLQDHADYFADYDGEELSVEDTQALSEDLSTLNQEVATFAEQYQASLESQESYFNGIGADDADADTFINGIGELVEEHDQLVSLSQSLNQTFDETLQTIDDFNQSVQEANEEAEN